MERNLLHQELARIRHAEALREASRRHTLLREEPRTSAVKPRRARLLRRFRPAYGV